jgi:hypothetical protein
MREKRWSIPKLLKESGLGCDRSSLQRKLKGKQKLSTEETEQLARALGCTLAFLPDEDAA